MQMRAEVEVECYTYFRLDSLSNLYVQIEGLSVIYWGIIQLDLVSC